jgi:hypothetical protein
MLSKTSASLVGGRILPGSIGQNWGRVCDAGHEAIVLEASEGPVGAWVNCMILYGRDCGRN